MGGRKGKNDRAREKRERERSAEAAVAPTMPLDEALTQAHHALREIERGRELIVAVDLQLKNCTRGKRFMIRSEPAWHVIGATWSDTVLALASWALELCSTGGLIDRVARHAESYRPSPGERSQLSAGAVALVARRYREDFERLFGALEAPPAPSAWASLKATLRESFKPLKVERDKLAHRHDDLKNEPSLLESHQLESHFALAHETLARLRLLGLHTGLQEPHNDDREGVAQDLIDLVLLGHAAVTMARAQPRWWKRRGELYDAMHAAHEQGANDSTPFNADSIRFVHRWMKGAAAGGGNTT